jgi:hypothetical protein
VGAKNWRKKKKEKRKGKREKGKEKRERTDLKVGLYKGFRA